MARLAGIVAGKGNRPGRYLSDRSAPVVPVLPKTARHDRSAQDNKGNHRYRHDGSEPDEVFYVLKQVRVLRQTPGANLRAKLRNVL